MVEPKRESDYLVRNIVDALHDADDIAWVVQSDSVHLAVIADDLAEVKARVMKEYAGHHFRYFSGHGDITFETIVKETKRDNVTTLEFTGKAVMPRQSWINLIKPVEYCEVLYISVGPTLEECANGNGYSRIRR